jgi:hypothetical protein
VKLSGTVGGIGERGIVTVHIHHHLSSPGRRHLRVDRIEPTGLVRKGRYLTEVDVIDPIKRLELEDQNCVRTRDFPALSIAGEAYGSAAVVQSDTVVDSDFAPRPIIEIASGIRAV